MRLTIATSEQITARVLTRWGDCQQDEALAELIRAEVTAWGHCPRWSALQRLERALGGAVEGARARLHALCERLEYEGDITVSSGAVLHVSPVRAVRLHNGAHRIVCSLPGHRLRALLPGSLEVEGVRRVHRFDLAAEAEAEGAVRALGGAVLSLEAWAGLALAPVADAGWLDGLNQRLRWQWEAGGSHERDGAIDWLCLTLTADGPRWRHKADEAARLWRARTPSGRSIWAWTEAGQRPSGSPFVTLMADEASRTLFAVAREAGCPVVAAVTRDDVSVHLRLREWLPRAEYRYLASIAVLLRTESHQQWSIPRARADDVLGTLCRRLGLDLTEEAPA